MGGFGISPRRINVFLFSCPVFGFVGMNSCARCSRQLGDVTGRIVAFCRFEQLGETSDDRFAQGSSGWYDRRLRFRSTTPLERIVQGGADETLREWMLMEYACHFPLCHWIRRDSALLLGVAE